MEVSTILPIGVFYLSSYMWHRTPRSLLMVAYLGYIHQKMLRIRRRSSMACPASCWVAFDISSSIIAIHGLGTTTPRTWEYRNKTGVVNWLSDPNMLPDVLPSARTYTFSWNANYSRTAPVTRIVNVAEILLSNLEDDRKKVKTHGITDMHGLILD